MSIKIGDTVKVHTTGDDRLDWAAGLTGEVINIRQITEYMPGASRHHSPAVCYDSITVRTSQGDVTVNDNEVTQL